VNLAAGCGASSVSTGAIGTAGRTAAAPWSGAGADVAAAVRIDEQRLATAFHNVPVDDDLLDAVQAGQVEHRLEQDAFHDGAQAPRTGLALDRLLGDRLQ